VERPGSWPERGATSFSGDPTCSSVTSGATRRRGSMGRRRTGATVEKSGTNRRLPAYKPSCFPCHVAYGNARH
jgi:hypothetical protein